EFHGEGAASLPVPDRATIGNMSPEYGATIGYFPVDEQTCRYLLATGRTEEHVELVRRYYTAQGLFGIPAAGACDYSSVIDLDLAEIEPSIAGPKRPQDRIELNRVKDQFHDLLTHADGYGKPPEDLERHFAWRNEQRQNEGESAPRSGGGCQTVETLPDGRTNDTSALTEIEMMNNRPTPNLTSRERSQRARSVENL